MSGVKTFINNTSLQLNIILLVRAGENPGCTLSPVRLCLGPNQTESVTYGCDANPFLDGVFVCCSTDEQRTSTGLRVLKRGSSADDLLNTNRLIFFAQAAESLTIYGANP